MASTPLLLATIFAIALIVIVFLIKKRISKHEVSHETHLNMSENKQSKNGSKRGLFLLLLLVASVSIGVYWSGHNRFDESSYHAALTAAENAIGYAAEIDSILQYFATAPEVSVEDQRKYSDILEQFRSAKTELNNGLQAISNNAGNASAESIIEYTKWLTDGVRKFFDVTTKIGDDYVLSVALNQPLNEIKELKNNNAALLAKNEKLLSNNNQLENQKSTLENEKLNLQALIESKIKLIDSLSSLNNSDQVGDLKNEIARLNFRYDSTVTVLNEIVSQKEVVINDLRERNKKYEKSILKKMDLPGFSTRGFNTWRDSIVSLNSFRNGFTISFQTKFLDQTLNTKERIIARLTYLDNNPHIVSSEGATDVLKDSNDQWNIVLKPRKAERGNYLLEMILESTGDVLAYEYFIVKKKVL